MNKDKRDKPENCIINNKINWNTIDKQTYQTLLIQDFQEELSVIGDTSDYINKLAETLKKCTLQSCDVKQTKIVGKKGHKPWTPEISARDAHWKWKEHGAGKDVEIVFFRNLKEAKRNLRRVQRQTAAEERNKLYHEIMDSFDNDKQLFYKLVRKQRNQKLSTLRNRPFNLQRGGGLFHSEMFFRTTRELEYIFFVAHSAKFFFQNRTLGYMTKTLNQIIFFPPPKSEYFF